VRPVIEFEPESHTYTVNGEAGYPSVTEVLKATVVKPFSVAAWYGYKLGALAARDAINGDGGLLLMDDDAVYDAAKKVRNPNSVLTKAGARGTAIHEALEAYAKHGTVPSPEDFEEEDRKRIYGIAGWLLDNRPEFIGSEIRTCSLEHRFVGTLDGYVRFEDGEFKGKTSRLDFKTSKRVYPEEHFCQLAAYEHAEVELGEDPSDLRLVIHIPESGRVKAVKADYSFQDFRVLLDVYKRGKERREEK
jgi:hypothetical protein